MKYPKQRDGFSAAGDANLRALPDTLGRVGGAEFRDDGSLGSTTVKRGPTSDEMLREGGEELRDPFISTRLTASMRLLERGYPAQKTALFSDVPDLTPVGVTTYVGDEYSVGVVRDGPFGDDITNTVTSMYRVVRAKTPRPGVARVSSEQANTGKASRLSAPIEIPRLVCTHVLPLGWKNAAERYAFAILFYWPGGARNLFVGNTGSDDLELVDRSEAFLEANRLAAGPHTTIASSGVPSDLVTVAGSYTFLNIVAPIGATPCVLAPGVVELWPSPNGVNVINAVPLTEGGFAPLPPELEIAANWPIVAIRSNNFCESWERRDHPELNQYLKFKFDQVVDFDTPSFVGEVRRAPIVRISRQRHYGERSVSACAGSYIFKCAAVPSETENVQPIDIGGGLTAWSPVWTYGMFRAEKDGSYVRLPWPGDTMASWSGADRFRNGNGQIALQWAVAEDSWVNFVQETGTWRSAGEGCAAFVFAKLQTRLPVTTLNYVFGYPDVYGDEIRVIATNDNGETWVTFDLENTELMRSFALLEEKSGSASMLFTQLNPETGLRRLMRIPPDLSAPVPYTGWYRADESLGIFNFGDSVHPGFPGVYDEPKS